VAPLGGLRLKNKVNLVFKRVDKEAGSQIAVETIPGDSGLHGITHSSASYWDGQSPDQATNDSAVVRVPATPKYAGVTAGQRMRLHILVHEFIHSIGLSNCAHGSLDVFEGVEDLSRATKRDGSDAWPWPPTISAETLWFIKKAWEIPEPWIYKYAVRQCTMATRNPTATLWFPHSRFTFVKAGEALRIRIGRSSQPGWTRLHRLGRCFPLLSSAAHFCVSRGQPS
jgi:hypothetical protein